jgi:hypothetical protein
VEGVADWNSSTSPEEMNVVESILEEFGSRVIQNFTDPLPCLALLVNSRPIIPSALSRVIERDNNGDVSSRSEPHTSNITSLSFDIWCNDCSRFNVSLVEIVKVLNSRCCPYFTFRTADLWELSLSVGLDEIEDSSMSKLPLAKYGGWMDAGEDLESSNDCAFCDSASYARDRRSSKESPTGSISESDNEIGAEPLEIVIEFLYVVEVLFLEVLAHP